jgi:hypothetical protein
MKLWCKSQAGAKETACENAVVATSHAKCTRPTRIFNAQCFEALASPKSSTFLEGRQHMGRCCTPGGAQWVWAYCLDLESGTGWCASYHGKNLYLSRKLSGPIVNKCNASHNTPVVPQQPHASLKPGSSHCSPHYCPALPLGTLHHISALPKSFWQQLPSSREMPYCM